MVCADRGVQPRLPFVRPDVVAATQLTTEFAAIGVTALLEAIRLADPSIRFYQTSSSEIFGEPLRAAD